ncbi:uncharacterized protein LOC113324786 [Papaver somniferum]|uniref:uncharacterized protein LOC113324786 n=1 Tax=Papaver somniferum TaxID=3469 RepID=UPI000E6FAB71|nr:uncharacterized protein LOC113324786 [Papaver somniferum]
MSKKRSREERIDRLHPFKLNIREFWPPMNFQVPKLPEFDEKTDDPDQHVLHYETAMTLWQYNNESIRDRNGCHALFLLGIRKEESIRQFTRRFKQELDDVDSSNDQVIIATYKQAYQYDQRGVCDSLVKRPLKNLEELYDRAEEYSRVEDDSKARETREVNRSYNHPNDGKKYKSKNRSSGKHNDRELYEKTSKDLSPPRPLPAETRDKRKHNNYHKDIGRKTENCRSLQIEVQRMIDAGKLHEYVKRDFRKGSGQFGTSHVINVTHARIHSMTRRASEDETRRKLRKLKEWYVTNHIDFSNGNGAEILEL